MASNATRTARKYRVKGQQAEEAARHVEQKLATVLNPREARMLHRLASYHRQRAARHFEKADHFTAVRTRAAKRRRDGIGA